MGLMPVDPIPPPPERRVAGQPEMVYVEWIDSHRSEGWLTPKEVEAAKETMECKTAGFVVHEDERVIVIALCAARSDCGSPWGSLMTIPKVAITLRASVVALYGPKP